MLIDRSRSLHVCNRGHPAIPRAKQAASRLWTRASAALLILGPVAVWWVGASWFWAIGAVALSLVIGAAARRSAVEFVGETARENPAFRREMVLAGVIAEDDDDAASPGLIVEDERGRRGAMHY